MPVKTRATNGRFETPDKPYLIETPVTFVIPKEWLSKLLRIAFLVLIISPWLFFIIKNNFYYNITKKVTDFYDDNFSCSNSCPDFCVNNSTISNITMQKAYKGF